MPRSRLWHRPETRGSTVVTEGWAGSPRESPRTSRSDDLERELALVDRLLGLEAQLAEQSLTFALTPSEQLRVEQQIGRMRSSLNWRVGRLVAAPVTLLSRRLSGRQRAR